VFEKLFGDSGSTERAAREARLRQHKSILDSVTEKPGEPEERARAARPGQGSTNMPRRFATSKRRIQKAEEQRDVELPPSLSHMEQPQGAPPVFEDHLALMLDLQLLAFQSDLTRVISFMLGKEQSARPYPQIGVPRRTIRCRTTTIFPSWSRTCPRSTAIIPSCSRNISQAPRHTDGDGSLLTT